jgi:endonuclease III
MDRAVAGKVLKALAKAYPDAGCELDFQNPFELLVATILSAQCTDRRVNEVTPSLFRRYPSVAVLAAADLDELEQLIRPTGFFRAKSRSLMGCALAIVERHGGQVPGSMQELVELPGVGRKTANVVLSHAFARHEGIAVDTHVLRVANRIGLVQAADAAGVENDLVALFPRSRWGQLSDLLIIHGRRTCTARRPACAACPVVRFCRFTGKDGPPAAGR